jgi:hypothetical protein
MSAEMQLEHMQDTYSATNELIEEVFGPVCPATAQLLCDVLAPWAQAYIPSIAEILQTPILATVAAKAQALIHSSALLSRCSITRCT